MSQVLLIALIVVLSLCALLWWRLGAALQRADYLQGKLEDTRKILAVSRARLDVLQLQAQALADVLFDPLLVFKVSTTPYTLILLNTAAAKVFRVDPQAAQGRTVMQVTRHHEIDALVEALAHGQEQPEAQILIEDNTFRMRGARIGEGSEALVVIALQDITELLRLARARRDMVANFSHDLRTPLSSIKLLIESLQMNLGRNPERDRKLLAKLAGEADSLHHMTQELIDLSMIESGRAIMRLLPVRALEVIESAFKIMETQFDQKRQRATYNVPPDLWILVDADQIRRVLTNLLHNAVKFTPAEGRITCVAYAVGESAQIEVTDTGIGIPPHERTRIFERFYQVDSARTGGGGSANRGGTGLGLAISKHIVEAHGGRIWAEAGLPPTGARLCFTVPLAEPPNAPQPTAESTALS
ncbi:MAG: PAS domain-containing sensor histidine kinase [Candidatus Thermofonsia Clade 1 bacterium]|uniref:histidine kinase n=1 Tax=Candidatus Thermofonsia Clade 1 bacterium TaxID=2364210 RepID=A0A2M8P2E4_9CHLR|nr:MAG: PAS domain-containing sensor histidine kinase [Candidatus Thermofonsia Clade 1 bacterium]